MVIEIEKGLEYRKDDLSPDGFYKINKAAQCYEKVELVSQEHKDKVKEALVAYEAKQYQRDRKYKSVAQQLEQIYDHISNGGTLDKKSQWFKDINAEKKRVPKVEAKESLILGLLAKITG